MLARRLTYEFDATLLTQNIPLRFPFKLPIKTPSIARIYDVLNDVSHAQHIKEWQDEQIMREQVPITLECGHSRAIARNLIEAGKTHFCDMCDDRRRIMQTVI